MIFQILHAHHGLFCAEHAVVPSSNFDQSLLQSFDRLLERGAFLRTDGTNFRRCNIFSRKQKTALALKLAYCLSGFANSEAVQPSWDGKKVFIVNRQATTDLSGSVPYISFTPAKGDQTAQPLLYGIEFAHPVLLSFAKLLLELESGERIDLTECQNHPIQQWGVLSERAWKAEVSGSGLYAEAVKGCLNLHMHYHVRVASDDQDPRIALGQTIEEQIVKQLEEAANPATAASRKRRPGDLGDQRGSKRRLQTAGPPSSQTIK